MAPKQAHGKSAPRRGRSQAGPVNISGKKVIPEVKAAKLAEDQLARNPQSLKWKFLGPNGATAQEIDEDFAAMGIPIQPKKKSQPVSTPINRGLTREKKKTAAGTKYEHLKVRIQDSNWVLADPIYYLPVKNAIDAIEEDDKLIKELAKYEPGNAKILEYNVQSNALCCKMTPEMLRNKIIEYTNLGPKIVQTAEPDQEGLPSTVQQPKRVRDEDEEAVEREQRPAKKSRKITGTIDNAAEAGNQQPLRRSTRARTAVPKLRDQSDVASRGAAATAAATTTNDGDVESEIEVSQPAAPAAATTMERKVAGAISRSLRAKAGVSKSAAGQRRGEGRGRATPAAGSTVAADGAVLKRKRGRPSKAELAARRLAAEVAAAEEG